MAGYFDVDAFVGAGRLTSLALSVDGSRLVAVREEPDAKGARYVPALWQLDPDGKQDAVRLTRSQTGDSQPAFRPDGSLLFVSARPVPDGGPDGASDGARDEPALWELPTWGEPRVVARSPGGVSAPVVAREAGTVLVGGSRLPGSADAGADRSARKDRDERKLSHVLHDGFPIRYWDHELDDAWPRLFALDGDQLRDLTGDTRQQLLAAEVSLTADGLTAATTWQVRQRAGQQSGSLALLDVPGGGVRRLISSPGYVFSSPVISPDGRHVAAVRENEGGYADPLTYAVVVFDLGSAPDTDDAAPVEVPTGDLYPTALSWSGDGSTLVVSGDLHGRGGLLAVEVDGWAVRTLAEDAVYLSVCVDHSGDTVYALRSTVDRPPHPVRLDRTGAATELPAPDKAPELPGRLVEITGTAPDGEPVHGWLCVPHGASAERPAPVQLWVHGGPFMSANGWSWRWCPWVPVARGYAVLLSDPALSTGYGPQWLARAWPHRAGTVWADLAAVLDAAVARPELAADRVACMGGSFGGYMTNWIAGHTDRFRAIVTHAGLWALDQQHDTTDMAHWKNRLIGTPAEHPDWFRENSPHHAADAIRTPMLVVHGNRDYRVPISEALRLWWDLVSRFPGEPDQLPHRFLQFTDENHWVLKPGDAQVWYTTVLGFVDQHVRG